MMKSFEAHYEAAKEQIPHLAKIHTCIFYSILLCPCICYKLYYLYVRIPMSLNSIQVNISCSFVGIWGFLFFVLSPALGLGGLAFFSTIVLHMDRKWARKLFTGLESLIYVCQGPWNITTWTMKEPALNTVVYHIWFCRPALYEPEQQSLCVNTYEVLLGVNASLWEVPNI